MADAKRKPRSNRGKAAIDWQQAFLYYAGLQPPVRSYAAVAEKYAVSVRTVERHGLREHWQDQARTIDAQALADAATAVGRQRADQLADVQKLIEASFLSYAQQLRDGSVRLSASDLPRLFKLLTELWGDQSEPTPDQPIAPTAAPAEASLEHMQDVLRTLYETGALTTDTTPPATETNDQEGAPE